MSSYLLDDEKFQKISNWLYMKATKTEYSHAIGRFIEFDYSEMSDDEKLKQRVKIIVRNYYNLNRLALVTRYGDTYDRNDNKQFEPKRGNTLTLEEIIETLESLQYQCAEYIMSNTKIFDSLGVFIGELCKRFFREKMENRRAANRDFE